MYLLDNLLIKNYYSVMALSEKVAILISEFIDEKTVRAVADFTTGTGNENDDVDLIAQMFGYSGSFSASTNDDHNKLILSFKNNLKLLIQKTWVEKSDVALKEEILFKLDVLFKNPVDWKKSYTKFLEILANAVYLMFGQQTKSDDFAEYSLRIDPEFGIFWWYIKSLPLSAEWPEDKCRNAVLLGMYFLANY